MVSCRLAPFAQLVRSNSFRPVLELGLAPKNISWKMKSDGRRYVALLQ
jgi:hypothetical protein